MNAAEFELVEMVDTGNRRCSSGDAGVHGNRSIGANPEFLFYIRAFSNGRGHEICPRAEYE